MQATTFALADSMRRLGTESAFVVLARAKALEAQGRDIIHLEIGEPDFNTPEHIKEAALRSLAANRTHYTPASGTLELRSTIAEYVNRTRGANVGIENVVVSPGAKPMIACVLMALLNPGDEIIIPDPAYPAYRSIATYVGAVPVPVPLLEARDFRFEISALEAAITPRTKMLVLNSPHNPTGGILTPQDIVQIADIVRKNDLLVISDEIYNSHCYDCDFSSYYGLAGLPERTILIDGCSKAWAMTGWRLGYGVMPSYIADAVGALILNTVSCTATFVQDAAIAALTGPTGPVEAMHAEFLRRRDLLVSGLRDIPGVTCRMPGGAFYVFPNTSAIDSDDIALANALLDDGGVAVLGGSTFGRYGRGYLRLSYANSEDNLRAALSRMKALFARYRN
ncbi:MAG: aspartate aminotransferase [Candidatus Eremiobacter antarcticus]|nr:pyridoxal phosphate-dependent aminotransferase [Candidatus Eremiobacteraeota bacterium]MBC5808191.1 pyridoxal phosphate-dependent aminotransferase [Candidatus Eremiobacteraeota bacterium]PZR63583.1 MAG: aspartate aminotransferase [Candidatus Eremiobacter sp. RRmetagenome_bin22]